VTERDDRIQQLIDQGLMEVVAVEGDQLITVLTEKGRQMADWEGEPVEVQKEKNEMEVEVH